MFYFRYALDHATTVFKKSNTDRTQYAHLNPYETILRSRENVQYKLIVILRKYRRLEMLNSSCTRNVPTGPEKGALVNDLQLWGVEGLMSVVRVGQRGVFAPIGPVHIPAAGETTSKSRSARGIYLLQLISIRPRTRLAIDASRIY